LGQFKIMRRAKPKQSRKPRYLPSRISGLKSMFKSFIPIAVLAVMVFGEIPTLADIVHISCKTTTSEELPQVVVAVLDSLADIPAESHQIIIQGNFTPLSVIKLQWFKETPLTVTTDDSRAVLDGVNLPKGKETVFMSGRNITLKGIHFVNSQGHAVIIGGKSDGYAIRKCLFEDCRQGAIHIWNDPHSIFSKTTRRGAITDNCITRFNLAGDKWANDGITVFDQRVTIARNTISSSSTETNGIRAMGRDLVVERNVIKDVARDDSGGIYLWGGPHASLFRGNVVRWNHVIGASRGIYLDDGTSGVRVMENVIEQSTVCAIFVSGGRDNIVERNVVDGSPVFVHIDSRCLGWDSRPEFAKMVEQSLSRLQKALLNTSSSRVLRERYPELGGLTSESLTPKDFGSPAGNRVRDNYTRDVDKTWELMDFANEVETDFRALNDLDLPLPITTRKRLSELRFQKWFGFEGLDRLENILDEATVFELQMGTTRNQ